jgi:hypothetical protein
MLACFWRAHCLKCQWHRNSAKLRCVDVYDLIDLACTGDTDSELACEKAALQAKERIRCENLLKAVSMVEQGTLRGI